MEKLLYKNKIINLLFFASIIIILTFSFKLASLINIIVVRLIVSVLLNVLMGIIAYLFIKKSKLKVDFGFKNWKSYVIGIIIALILQLFIGIIPALFGQSLVGSHTDFVLWKLFYYFFFYVFIIGPIEELIFRVYLQDSLIDLLLRHKWLGVLFASLLFGFWHLINGSIIQVAFTTLIGCALGFSKYFIKNCQYTSVALAHGLYDFLNVVTTIIIVK